MEVGIVRVVWAEVGLACLNLMLRMCLMLKLAASLNLPDATSSATANETTTKTNLEVVFVVVERAREVDVGGSTDMRTEVEVVSILSAVSTISQTGVG